MLLTGQPFVDLGMAIAALHAKKTSVADVTDLDLQEAVCWMNTQVDPQKSHPGPLNKLKFLSSYWQNNPPQTVKKFLLVYLYLAVSQVKFCVLRNRREVVIRAVSSCEKRTKHYLTND